ncbi:hypothetical protein BH20ACT21_BH20ACT21_20560 [soil metagenome]
MSNDYAEAPSVSISNSDPTLRDDSVRAFIDAENSKAATMFSRIADTDDEREQMQRYSDSLLIVYRAGYLATSAMLEARSVQLQKLLEHNDQAQRSLAKARNDLSASRSQLQRQPVEAKGKGAPIVINVSAAKPGSKRIEHDDAGRIVRIVEDPVDA